MTNLERAASKQQQRLNRFFLLYTKLLSLAKQLGPPENYEHKCVKKYKFKFKNKYD